MRCFYDVVEFYKQSNWVLNKDTIFVPIGLKFGHCDIDKIQEYPSIDIEYTYWLK